MQAPSSGQPVDSVRLIHADAAIDAAGCAISPAAMVIRGGCVEVVDRPQAIGPLEAEVEEVQGVLLPGLVNAHAHLDLSDQGIWPPAGSDFRSWVGKVRDLRGQRTEADTAAAVRRGIDLALAGGTCLIGDIVGHPARASIEALAASPLQGVAWIEVFGVGRNAAQGAAQVDAIDRAWPTDVGGMRIGLSPHAPYSCDRRVYQAAAETGRHLSTHLAELPAELEFLASGTGPLRDMLEHDIGVWSPHDAVPGCHPVPHLADVLGQSSGLCAHCNWLQEAHVDQLAEVGAQVVYCPRASQAFGHAPPVLPSHPWAMLRSAGVNVCLGTDSLLCLDTPDRISVLDDMRLLMQRDGVDALTLLAMATIDGAAALGWPQSSVCLGPGCHAVLCLPATGSTPLQMLESAILGVHTPTWVLSPMDSFSKL